MNYKKYLNLINLFINSQNSNLNFDYNAHAIYRLEKAISKMESKEYELWINNI